MNNVITIQGKQATHTILTRKPLEAWPQDGKKRQHWEKIDSYGASGSYASVTAAKRTFSRMLKDYGWPKPVTVEIWPHVSGRAEVFIIIEE